MGYGTQRSSRALAALVPAVLFLGSPLDAQEIRGHLLESGTGRPIASGAVFLLDEAGETIDVVEADSVGFFRLGAEDPGVYYLRARHQGYRERTDGAFEMGVGGRLEVEFYLRPDAIELDGVDVEVERVDPLLRRLEDRVRAQGFYEREKMGFGHFFSPRDLEEDPPMEVRQLLVGLVGLDAAAATTGVITLRGRGCGAGGTGGPTFGGWINGVKAFEGSSWRLADAIHPADIGAVEIYTRSVQLPLQYQLPGLCGAVLIWTK